MSLFQPEFSIERIKVENFRSFDKLDIRLDRLNVIIGSNASGKTNFVQIINFLRDIFRHGIDNAISLQGGITSLTNAKIGKDKNLKFEIFIITNPQGYRIGFNPGNLYRVKSITYMLSLKFSSKKRYSIDYEEVLVNVDYFEKEKTPIDGRLRIYRENNHIRLENYINEKLAPLKIIPRYLDRRFDQPIGSKKLIVNDKLLSFILGPHDFSDIIGQIGIYDIDPKVSKKAVPITGKIDLEEDGGNLPIVLQKLLSDKNNKRALINLLNDVLPFIHDLRSVTVADKSLILKVNEKYYPKKFLSASLISDGTVNIISLILILYFEQKSVILLEEPERNIHPYLLSRVIGMMKDASMQKQVIITTHNPEIVKYSGLENIFLLRRNKNGFSEVAKPQDSLEVKNFLENKLEIDDLYVQNLLS